MKRTPTKHLGAQRERDCVRAWMRRQRKQLPRNTFKREAQAAVLDALDAFLRGRVARFRARQGGL